MQVPGAHAAGGLFTKDRLGIDLGAGTVTCPNNVTVNIRRGPDGAGTASFVRSCANCPLRDQCTTAAGGRTIVVGAHKSALARARNRQKDPGWALITGPPAQRSNANLATSCAAVTAGGELVYVAGRK